MRLRFIFLLWLLAGLIAQGAVPVYKNDTLTLIPIYLARSNFLDSPTLTWTVDGDGRMTPNVIGGASSNAQPPSVNLTNWSTVSTQALRRAKTVFVSTNGNNATGAREWIHLPFANPIFAKTNAQPGDLIWVSAGDYVCNDLLKNGVNWWFDPGARVRWTNNTDASASARVVFDDRFLGGAITSAVWGAGEFYFEGRRETNASMVGLAYLTNGGTFVFKGAKAEASVTTGGNGAGIFFAPITRTISIDFPIIRDPNRFTPMYNDIFDFYSQVQGVFWGLGEMHLKFDVIDASYYGVWGEDYLPGLYTNTTGAPYNAWVQGNLITSSNAAAIYQEGKRQNYKMWVDVKEVHSDDSPAVTVFGSPSFYLTTQKALSQGSGRDAIEVSGEGAALVWLTVQKVSSDNDGWLIMDTSQSGTIWADIQHYEDLGGMVRGILNRSTNGGTIKLRGGRGDITNAIGVLHQSGNTFIDGLTLNVHGTTTNSWPVEVRGSGLTLKDTVWGAPASGTTNSIVATNAAQTVTVMGSISASTNKHPNVTLTSGDMERRSADGYWASPAASVLGPYILRESGFGTNTDLYGITESAGTNRMGNLAVTNRVMQKIQTLAYIGTNVTIDLSQGNIFALTATNSAKFWPTNGPGAGWSQQAIVYVDMDGTGGYSFYKDDVTSETNYTSLVFTNTANAKNTMWISSDRTGTNFQFLVNPGFSK